MLSLPGADVDARDPDSGWTALHFASRQGKIGAVEVLIERKAFVGARGPEGRTPLHLAAGWGTYEASIHVRGTSCWSVLWVKGIQFVSLSQTYLTIEVLLDETERER